MAKYNPFNPNSVVVPNLFAGRSQQINDICKKLSQLKHKMPSSFFIYGERGIGKTALAKLIKYISTENIENLHNLNLLTSYYPVEVGQSIGSVLQESVNKLTDGMNESALKTIGEKVGELFKNGKFQIGAFGASISAELGDQDKKEKEISIKDQTVSILSNMIKSLDESENIKKDGVLIIIDEVHNLNDLPSLASIIRNIVTSLDVENMGKVSFMLIGYDIDVDTFFSKDSSARRTFDLVELGVMPTDEAIQVFKKGFEEAGIKHDEEELKNNIDVAGGYPHSLQIIGHDLVDVDRDGVVDKTDWDEAIIRSAIALKNKEFSLMYKFDKPLTQGDKILQLLAKENVPMTKKEISEKTSIKNIYQHLSMLKKSGAIKENKDEKIVLHSQIFKTAILIDTYIRETPPVQHDQTVTDANEEIPQ